MKLEYIADNTGGGKYPDAWPTKLIRLFDFDEQQNQQLIELLTECLLKQGTPVELTKVPFISYVICHLLLRFSPIDKGIVALREPTSFACDLTAASYAAMLEIMKTVSDGYNWLADASEEKIEFLYSAGGAW